VRVVVLAPQVVVQVIVSRHIHAQLTVLAT
jgi:hypothetical protein